MMRLIEEVNQIVDEVIQERTKRVILKALLDMGECMGVIDQGTPMADFKDAVPCDADASVALIAPEYEQIVLCLRCYERLQKRGEL